MSCQQQRQLHRCFMTSVQEELEVLSSIYLSDLTRASPSSSSSAFTVRIACSASAAHDGSHVLLCFSLPSSYPASSPPALSIDDPARCFSEEERTVMMTAAEAVWEERRGEVCCYQQVEAIRELLLRLEEEREEERRRRQPQSAEDAAAVNAVVDDEEGEEAEWEEDRADADTGSIAVQPRAVPAVPSLQPSDASFPFVSGCPVTERRSVFQAHVAALTTASALQPLLQAVSSHPRLSRASHNMRAYRLSSGSYAEDGCDDDGEQRAGGRLLHLLQAMQAVNVLVVVSRWYGGVKLGSDRFRIINNVARELLEREGWGADRRRDTAGAAAAGRAAADAAGGKKTGKKDRVKR